MNAPFVHNHRWLWPVLVVALVLAQAATAWSTRATWLGHQPLTSAAFLTASLWPGFALSSLGSLVVLVPRLTGTDYLYRTAVASENRLLRRPLGLLALSAAIASLLVVVVMVSVTSALHGFGRPIVPIIVTGLVWPQVALLWGAWLCSIAPRAARPIIPIASLLMLFGTVFFTLQLNPGAVATLSPGNATVTPDRLESMTTAWLRLALIVVCGALIASLLWARRAWKGLALAASTVIAAALWLLPHMPGQIEGATDVHCRGSSPQVCWAEWGRSSSALFVTTVNEAIAPLPADLRPTRVVGVAGESNQTTWAVGYPGGNNVEAPRPQAPLIKRAVAESLVTSTCRPNPSTDMFYQRALDLVGVDPERGTPQWIPTRAQYRSWLTAEDLKLFDLVLAMPDQQFYDHLRLRSTPEGCQRSNAEWLKALHGR